MAQRQQTLKEAESYFNGVIPKGEELRQKAAVCNQGISVRKAMEIYCLTVEEQEQCKDNFPMVDNARLEEKYAEAQELESLESTIRKNALSGEESRRLEELSGYFAEGMPQEAEIDSVKMPGRTAMKEKSSAGERNTAENPAIHTGTGRCQMLTGAGRSR